MTASTMALGIDVGSTTVKALVYSPSTGRVLVSHVARHHGALRAAARRAVIALGIGDEPIRVFFTGSGARAIAGAASSRIVHEVSATAAVVRVRHPTVRSVVEIGGQDAKVLRIDDQADGSVAHTDASMNDRCAAGTGVTLDRCLMRLGDESRRWLTSEYEHSRVRPLSTKCGVFAETDLVNLVRRGIPVGDALVSLADALVQQTLSVLLRGRALAPETLLLGGPAFHFRALVGAWRHHLAAMWGLEVDQARALVHVPDDAVLYAAMGACIEGVRRFDETPVRASLLVARLARAQVSWSGATARIDDSFAQGSIAAAPARAAWPGRTTPRKPGFSLGIDAGSTRFKGVALDVHDRVVASVEMASGDPAENALGVRDALLARIATLEHGGHGACSIGVTGYGAAAVGALLCADTLVVETVAHARAARAAVPHADVVCDVGGQDVKVLVLDDDGAVRDFRMSGQCHAGIGMLLESSARELGVRLSRIGAIARSAQRAPRFGEGCAVFLDADRVAFQRQGFDRAEVLAGLTRALPRIVWQQVVAGTSVASLGRTFVLSGGVQNNEAAAAAQVAYLRERVPDADVRIHPYPSLAGAIGAALLARDEHDASSVLFPSLTGSAPVVSFESAHAPRCTLCPSSCPRTFLDATHADDTRRRHVLGAACEAGEESEPSAAGRSHVRRRRHELPDLLTDESRRLFLPARVAPIRALATRTRVGIPRVLGMYRSAPFFSGYLQTLGVPPRDVVFSPETSDELWRRASALGCTDPCFPVKVVLAHAAHLVRDVELLLVPRITHAVTPVETAIDCTSCPVVASAPSLVRDALEAGALGPRRPELIDGPVSLHDERLLRPQMYTLLGDRLGASRAQSDLAVERGLDAMRAFDEWLRARASGVLRRLEQQRGSAAVLVLARPYHADPGINHRLGSEIVSMGYPVLTIRSLPRDPALSPPDVRDLVPDARNSGALERLWAARYAARHGRLAVLDLSSFKCAQDTITAGPVRELLDAARVVTCHVHDLDETRPVITLRTRVRTFAHALRQRGFAPWTPRSSSPA